MKKNTAFLTCLSMCTLPLYAQNSIPAGAIQIQGNGAVTISEADIQFAEEQMQMQMQEGGAMPQNANQQMIQKYLRQVQINRSPSGIIEARLAAKHNPVEVPELSAEEVQKLPRNQQMARLQSVLRLIQSDVTLSNWPRLKTTLASLPKDQASAIYSYVLQQLSQPARVNPKAEIAAAGAKPHTQEQFFPAIDLLPLADAAPSPLDSGTISLLAKLIGADNRPLPAFYESLEKGNESLGKTNPSTKLNTAELLIKAGLLEKASDYLPSRDEAEKTNNYRAQDLISQYFTTSYKSKREKELLVNSWESSTHILSTKDAPYQNRVSALYRALSLIPDLQDDISSKWLKDTFATTDSVGYEILSAIGTASSQSRQVRDSSFRLEQLKMQTAAVSTLLENTKVDPAEWSELLTLYLLNWNQEADYSYKHDTSNSLRPEMQSDSYGNIFYMPQQMQNRTQLMVLPIRSGDLLDLQASKKWLALVDNSVRMDYLVNASKLYLKVKEEERAFPLLKEIAKSRPEQTKGLVREMINVWSENHNPNTQNTRYRSSYFYMYGINQRAEAIPLTRSKQERNLLQLAKLIKEVQSLELGESFQKEFANAFVAAHSTAEVWRLETLESVFGPMDTMQPEVISALLDRMRGNLAGLWPDPKVQIEAKTKRTDKELQQQILKGYDMSRKLCEACLKSHPEDWKLRLHKAALLEEESNYKSSISSNSSHAIDKQDAMELFAEAAATYASKIPFDQTNKETVEPYTQWFFGALGSPALSALKNHHQPMPAEYAKIKEALDFVAASDPASGERHLKSFAKALNMSLASVAPDLKFRYLKAAMSIIGDHPEFSDGRQIYQYYNDLVTEVKLDTYVDGSTDIYADKPFGMYINLKHTREIEREANGFQRYLVNQSNSASGYNFGRPTEDYRDKFEKSVRSALSENFDIVSITFHSSKVESRSDSKPGWTLTPYAYILMKPKGPQVDTIPPLKIDLDFLDTSGYVVLPITSAAIPISANAADAARPVRDLKVVMALDERKLEKEKTLQLEIKANAHGLVPALDKLVQLPPKGYKVESIEDRDLQIVELDAQTDDLAPVSSHEWVLTLKADGDASAKEFTFPEVLLPTAAEEGLIRQRYQDVDLVTVEQTVTLAESPVSTAKYWFLGIGAVLLALVAFFVTRSRKTTTEEVSQSGLSLPSHLTPVTLLAYLKKTVETLNLNDTQKEEIQADINQIQTQAFGPDNTPPNEDELKAIATRWHKLA